MEFWFAIPPSVRRIVAPPAQPEPSGLAIAVPGAAGQADANSLPVPIMAFEDFVNETPAASRVVTQVALSESGRNTDSEAKRASASEPASGNGGASQNQSHVRAGRAPKHIASNVTGSGSKGALAAASGGPSGGPSRATGGAISSMPAIAEDAENTAGENTHSQSNGRPWGLIGAAGVFILGGAAFIIDRWSKRESE